MDKSEFVFAFAVVTFLLLVAVIMACVDAVNNLRLQREMQKQIREEVARLRVEIERKRVENIAVSPDKADGQ